jgi:hypothetical protein
VKIAKSKLRKIIKEEVAKYTDVTQSRDAARPGEPVGPQEAHNLAATLEGMGFSLTRGGRTQLEEFLRGLEENGDLRRA